MNAPITCHPAPYLRLVAGIAVALAGCVGRAPADRPPILDTPLGGEIGGLWEAHGGLESLSRFEGVIFSYRAETPAEVVTWPRLAIRFDTPEALWVGEADPQYEGATSWRRVLVASRGAGAAPDRTARPRSYATIAGYTLTSARLFFHLPLALLHGGWEYHTLLVPSDPGVELPTDVKLSPSGWRSDFGPVILPAMDAGANAEPLARAIYGARHPAARKGIYEVTFDAYRSVQGVVLALEREHWHRAPRTPREPPDPLRPELFPAPEPPRPLLKERLSGVRFLTREEVEALGLDSDRTP